MHLSTLASPTSVRFLAIVICASISFVACGDENDHAGSFLIAEPDTITLHVVHGEVPPPCSVPAGTGEVVFPRPYDRPASCVIAGPAEIDATDVVDVKVEKGNDPGESIVVMQLSDEAAATFDDMKRRTAGGRIATVLEGRLEQLPTYALDPKFRGVASVILPPGKAQILASRLQRRASP